MGSHEGGAAVARYMTKGSVAMKGDPPMGREGAALVSSMADHRRVLQPWKVNWATKADGAGGSSSGELHERPQKSVTAMGRWIGGVAWPRGCRWKRRGMEGGMSRGRSVEEG